MDLNRGQWAMSFEGVLGLCLPMQNHDAGRFLARTKRGSIPTTFLS
jgi:hypothetical protein